tara:strand:+ start:744 stop:950 length:207 start_codon:yes stop_codon:yes gene_type:complete
MDDIPCENTDVEIWRKEKDNYYSPSIHVTKNGSIGINVGGTVYVKDVEQWHKQKEVIEILTNIINGMV